MYKIKSNEIKVFPTSRRNDIFDRNARLNSEQNLISIINRLTDIKSFVIDGLNFDTVSTDWKLKAGSCNINGYYFNLQNDILASTLTHNSNNNLYLKISIQENSQLDSNNVTVKFNELIGNDSSSNTATSEYSGLEFTDNISVGSNSDNYLLIGTWNNVNSRWETNPNRFLKFNQNSVKIDDGELL